ncbi:MAG: hypothetical protein RL161_1319 [Bacteroidota bacterium]
MKESNGKAVAAEVVKLLEQSRNELENYRKALAQDQRRLADHLEELRSELIDSLTDMRTAFSDARSLTSETSQRLMVKVDELQEKLAHVPGTDPDLLKNWLSGIRKILTAIIRDLGGEGMFTGKLVRLTDRIHRLKIKADILRLKLRLGAMDIRDVVLDTRRSFREKMATLRTYASRKEELLGKRIQHFRKEVSEAYDHLSKALASK